MSSTILQADPMSIELPDHKQLPDRDESVMPNMQQPPQTEMLNQSLIPVLNEIHPDRRYCVAGDCFIYYRYTQPVLAGCKGPDWFYVPGVEPMLNGEIRRSYVLWKEGVRPLVVIEYVSDDGSEEHDATPQTGKFWVYENAIGATFYVIFDPQRSALEVYELAGGRYQLMTPNAQGRFFIPALRVELGVWEGVFRELNGAWLRAWDSVTGRMLPIDVERIEAVEAGLEETRTLLNEQIDQTRAERTRADEQAKLAEEKNKLAEEKNKLAERLAEKLRSLGINPDELAAS